MGEEKKKSSIGLEGNIIFSIQSKHFSAIFTPQCSLQWEMETLQDASGDETPPGVLRAGGCGGTRHLSVLVPSVLLPGFEAKYGAEIRGRGL